MQDLPEGIGPHEGREFDLMRRGEKHVAMFTDYEPDGLADILADGRFSSFTDQREFRGIGFEVIFVFRKGHEDTARQLCALTRNPPKGFSPAHERKVGQLLGYSDPQIDAFLTHVQAQGH